MPLEIGEKKGSVRLLLGYWMKATNITICRPYFLSITQASTHSCLFYTYMQGTS